MNKKMREAALSAKAELRERFKVFAKSQAGLLLSTQNQAVHAERSERKPMKMIQTVKITG